MKFWGEYAVCKLIPVNQCEEILIPHICFLRAVALHFESPLNVAAVFGVGFFVSFLSNETL